MEIEINILIQCTAASPLRAYNDIEGSQDTRQAFENYTALCNNSTFVELESSWELSSYSQFTPFN